MNARRRLFILGGLGGLVVLGLAVFFAEAASRRSTARALAGLSAERDRLMAAVESEHRQVAVSSHPSVTPSTQPAPAARGENLAAKPPPPRTMSDIIAHEPTLQLLELARQRGAVNEEYRRFFTQVGLSPEAIEKFRANRQKWAEAEMDLSAARKNQDKLGQKVAADLVRQAEADYRAAQRELLGPAGYRQLENYESTISVYNVVVRGLAGAAAIDGIPLTPEQGERLVAATVAASSGLQGARGIDFTSIDVSRLDAQARQILTPAQFDLFHAVQAPSGFRGRLEDQLDAAFRRALAVDPVPVALPSAVRPP